jgi:anoctamin-10/anoctamin-7
MICFQFAVYGKYESDLPQDMYLDIEEDPRTGGNHFTKYVRLKLLYYILKAPTRVGGCNLQISNLLFAKKIEAFFPLHETNITNRIASASGCCSSPWSFPFTQFRNYFGEKISLYMVFIGHYSKWLIVPSIVGILFQLVVWGTDNYSSPVLPFYAVLITVWAIMMIEYWKREEKSTAMIWGMIGFEHDEPDRPEFVGDLIKSYIDGGEMYYFSKKEFGERVAGSVSVIGAFILLLLGVVASIYVMRFALEPSLHANASTLASICNTIQITIFNMIYQKVVVALTDAENHRTDTEYEDSMTVKLFAFQFINSYASFFFLAFIAQNLDPSSDAPDDYNGQCGADTCMKPLSVNLAIIFCTRIASGFATNVIAPKIQSDMKRRSEGGARNLTPPEMNYALMNYNTMIEGINNYADAALQFGFSILFVTALPLAPFMSLVANWARIKGMAWKLCRLYQRPIPLGAEDIGTWMPIFQFVAIAAVVTNGGLVCFTMNSLSEFSNWGRVW